MDFVVAESADGDINFDLVNGETYTFETARITKDDYSVTILRIFSGTTDVSKVITEMDAEQQCNPDTDEQAIATDGGEETP